MTGSDRSIAAGRRYLTQSWQVRPDVLLIAYVLLSAVTFALGLFTGPRHAPPTGSQLFESLATDAFFTWRVWRGGRISRMLLIIGSGLSYAIVAFSIARHFSPVSLSLLVILAVQIAMLVSPAIYRHTRREGYVRPDAGTAPRVRAPVTLFTFGVLAGLVVTLIYLSSMDWAAVPGCGPAHATLAQLPARCTGLTEGYPLRWLTGSQRTLVVDWDAMLKDWVQYSIITTSVLYLLWPRISMARELRRIQIPAPGEALLLSALAGLTFTVLTRGFPLSWVSARQGEPVFNLGNMVTDAALWALACFSTWCLLWLTRVRRQEIPPAVRV